MPCLSRFPRELRVRYFARDARAYLTERSAPIPGSNPASKTGRVLSHLSIQLVLYSVNSINAIPDIPSPQVRGLFPLVYERKIVRKKFPRAHVPLLRSKSGTSGTSASTPR